MEITNIIIRKTPDAGKLMAYVTITFDDCFVVHNVKIIKGNTGIFLAMPSRKTKSGEYKDVAHPIHPEFRAKIEEMILEKYNQGNLSDDLSIDL